MERKVRCINGTGKMLITGQVYTFGSRCWGGNITLEEFGDKEFKESRFRNLIPARVTKKMVIRISDNYVFGQVSEMMKGWTEEEQIKYVVSRCLFLSNRQIDFKKFRIVEMTGIYYK